MPAFPLPVCGIYLYGFEIGVPHEEGKPEPMLPVCLLAPCKGVERSIRVSRQLTKWRDGDGDEHMSK